MTNKTTNPLPAKLNLINPVKNKEGKLFKPMPPNKVLFGKREREQEQEK